MTDKLFDDVAWENKEIKKESDKKQIKKNKSENKTFVASDNDSVRVEKRNGKTKLFAIRDALLKEIERLAEDEKIDEDLASIPDGDLCKLVETVLFKLLKSINETKIKGTNLKDLVQASGALERQLRILKKDKKSNKLDAPKAPSLNVNVNDII